jgi:hypothetical protein
MINVTRRIGDDLTLGKPEWYKVHSVGQECRTPVNKFTATTFSMISDPTWTISDLNLGTASTKWDLTRSVTHSGGSWPNCVCNFTSSTPYLIEPGQICKNHTDSRTYLNSSLSSAAICSKGKSIPISVLLQFFPHLAAPSQLSSRIMVNSVSSDILTRASPGNWKAVRL